MGVDITQKPFNIGRFIKGFWKHLAHIYREPIQECCGSVVESLTRDRGVVGSSITGCSSLGPRARHFIHCFVDTRLTGTKRIKHNKTKSQSTASYKRRNVSFIALIKKNLHNNCFFYALASLSPIQSTS